jgi:F-type H+-transporting ATPase subunit alpha
VIIYAGTNGYVDKLPIDALREYEQELFRHLDDKHSELVTELREKKEITDEIKKKLDKVLKKFTDKFVASKEK